MNPVLKDWLKTTEAWATFNRHLHNLETDLYPQLTPEQDGHCPAGTGMLPRSEWHASTSGEVMTSIGIERVAGNSSEAVIPVIDSNDFTVDNEVI